MELPSYLGNEKNKDIEEVKEVKEEKGPKSKGK